MFVRVSIGSVRVNEGIANSEQTANIALSALGESQELVS
jgi:hypothetical protein